jgi:fructokinase
MNRPPRIVSLGEVLWDLLPSGAQLGGAPGNFACHCRALGAEAALVSCVGADDLGDKALHHLSARGVDVSAIARAGQFPTGTVAVELAADGQPKFTIREQVAWDRLAATEPALKLASAADVVCFGSLAQRTPAAREALRKLVQAAPPSALRVCDINLRAPFVSPEIIAGSLELANVLKLNETELPVLAPQFALRGSAEEQLDHLAEQFGLHTVALTLGASGSRVRRAGTWTFEPGRAVRVVDAVGAGDAYTAALVMGLLQAWPTSELMAAATEIAAYVCTQPGATPALPAELTAPFRTKSVTR